jgi:hypothetical protein
MKKYSVICSLVLLLFTVSVFSKTNPEVPEIILEGGYFYAVQPNGEKFVIVKEHEPWAMNKAKPSPNGKYILYTTANGLGFECEGRDLFYCTNDGMERTFLHKFPAYVDDWFWVEKNNRNFLIVLNRGSMSGPGIWVLDLDEKKLLLSFRGDSVERAQDSGCFLLIGIRKERKICPDELIQMSEKMTPLPEIFLDWAAIQFYLNSKRDPILSSKEILEAFSTMYRVLPEEQMELYDETLQNLLRGNVLLGGPFPAGSDDTFVFNCNGISGTFNIQKRMMESLNVRGQLSLQAFWSPYGRYFALLKTELAGIKKLIIWGMIGDEIWENILFKEFSPEVNISNVAWSTSDETKIYYSIQEGDLSKDSVMIDLTQAGKN